MTSGVDLLLGLAKWWACVPVHPGVTGDIENDYEAQVQGSLRALEQEDLVVVHVEAPMRRDMMGP